MEAERCSRIQDLFFEALNLPEGERDAFLKSASGADAEIMKEVTAMLAADGRKTSMLDRGLPELANRLVGTTIDAIPAQDFGPYRLKKVLGEGGMGVVWLAERSDARNLVAIKFLPHAGLTPARKDRFAREIRTHAKLKHPYIARLYDAGLSPMERPGLSWSMWMASGSQTTAALRDARRKNNYEPSAWFAKRCNMLMARRSSTATSSPQTFS